MVLHGIGDSRQGSAGFAPLFLDQGYSVLLPDSRGHGASGGELVTYGLWEKYDVLDWARWLRQHDCQVALRARRVSRRFRPDPGRGARRRLPCDRRGVRLRGPAGDRPIASATDVRFRPMVPGAECHYVCEIPLWPRLASGVAPREHAPHLDADPADSWPRRFANALLALAGVGPRQCPSPSYGWCRTPNTPQRIRRRPTNFAAACWHGSPATKAISRERSYPPRWSRSWSLSGRWWEPLSLRNSPD